METENYSRLCRANTPFWLQINCPKGAYVGSIDKYGAIPERVKYHDNTIIITIWDLSLIMWFFI